MEENNPLKAKQVDHLILLVGGNPLPNAVSGRVLLKPGGTITLIHSKDTQRLALNLKKWFGVQTTVKLKEIEEANEKSIYNGVLAVLKNTTGQVGLNYTGGTKAMSVHAYRAVEAWSKEGNKPSPIYSYLDARTLRMNFNDGWSCYTPLLPSIKNISLNDLFLLHNLTMHSALDNCHLETLANHPILNNPTDYGGDGKKFEKAVAQQLMEVKDTIPLQQVCINVKAGWSPTPQKTDPEFDLVAIRGYQLFLLSCSIKNPSKDGARAELKHKLFEAFIRARQLGGDEACAALVCYDDDPTLEPEIQQSLGVAGRVKVFGRSFLPKLSEHLANWIKTQVGQERL